MRKLMAAVLGAGALVATSAYADHYPGSSASGYEVQTPRSVNESAPAGWGVVRGRDSQSVYHPGHTPQSVDDNSPAGSSIGSTRSDRAGGTTGGRDGYSLFGLRFTTPGFPSSVAD